MKRVLAGVATASLMVAGMVGTAMAEDYPCKTIRVIVASSAGGGTDSYARKFGALVEEHLGSKVVVTNMPGGLGGKGAEAVWQAEKDGCTILGMSETSMTYGVNGASTTTAKDWNYYIFAGSPGVIAVQADSPYETFEDLLAAARENPETVTVANSGIGKLWHLKVAMVEKAADVKFKHVGFDGSKPAMTSLLTGEVEAVSASTGEVAPYVESGKMRVLATTELEDFTFANGDVAPSMTKALPEASKFLPMGQFLAWLVPDGVDQEKLEMLDAAFDKVMASPEFLEFVEGRGATLYAKGLGEGSEMAEKMERSFSWFMADLGMAKVDPASIGIERP